ncbi:MAG: TrmH family RNA methyltransferase [Allomuricauda sp.]|nr:MAG: TrmH family RNA methyltransferase [Allomuricauda sp.]
MFDYDLLNYLEGYLTENRKQRFLEVLANRTNFLTVAVEDVFQLHNTSAVLRSCDAFGIQTLHVIEDRFGQRLDKNIAMGAEQWVDVNRYAKSKDCIKALKDTGYEIVATTPHEKSHTVQAFEFKSKTALFFGTEREGLSEEVLQMADRSIHIPMQGFTESLNISVCAAIAIRDLKEKLVHSNYDWQLSETELLEKRLDWTKKSIKDVEGIINRYRSD